MCSASVAGVGGACDVIGMGAWFAKLLLLLVVIAVGGGCEDEDDGGDRGVDSGRSPGVTVPGSEDARGLLCPTCSTSAGGDTSDFGGAGSWADPACALDVVSLDEARALGAEVWPYEGSTREFEGPVRWEHAPENVSTATVRIEHPGTVLLAHRGDGGTCRAARALETVTVTVDTSDGFVQGATFDALADTRRFGDRGSGFLQMGGDVSASARGTLDFPTENTEGQSLWMTVNNGPKIPGRPERLSIMIRLAPHPIQPGGDEGLAYRAGPPDGCPDGGFSPDLYPEYAQYAVYCEPTGHDGVQCCGWEDSVVLSNFRFPEAQSEDGGI